MAIFLWRTPGGVSPRYPPAPFFLPISNSQLLLVYTKICNSQIANLIFTSQQN
nr:MAG TPA: hypothetical protein [Caudoviricetes sp.]